MIKRSNRIRRWFVVSALLVAAIVAAVSLAPRTPILPRDANFVAKTELWHKGERFNYDAGVHWLSDHELMYSRFDGPNPGDCVVYKRNVVTGLEQKLTEFTKSFDKMGAEVVDSQSVSPDGRWFVRSARWRECYIGELNGSRFHIYPSLNDGDYRSIFWMTDSRHWLENYEANGGSDRLVIHDVEHPTLSTMVPVDGRADMIGRLCAVVSRDDAMSIVDTAPDDDIVPSVPVEHASVPHILKVIRFSLVANRNTRMQYNVAVPEGAKHYELVIAPRGDRIAWQVSVLHSNPFRAIFHRLLPFVNPEVQRLTEVWVSDIDGTHGHVVGRVADSLTARDSDPLYLSLMWLPGEKWLSFELNEKLYTVPAD